MKKHILITLMILLSIFVIHQIYWYRLLDGNFMIWINNQSEIGVIEDFEVYLDNKKVIQESLKSSLLDYKSYKFKLSPGKHHLRVVSNVNNINREKVFYLFSVKRTIIEFSDDYEDFNNPNKIRVSINIRNVLGKMIVQ